MQIRGIATALIGVAIGACGDPTGPEVVDVDKSTCGEVHVIQLAAPMLDRLTATDCRAADGTFSDTWTLTVDRDLTVVISLSSATFDTYLELRDASGAVIGANDDAGFTLNSRVVRAVPAGSYSIVVSSYRSGVTGTYRLSVVEGADCSPVGRVEVGTTVTGALSVDDCLPEFGGVQDNWTFTLDSPGELRFVMTGPDFPGLLLLRDGRGQAVASAYTNAAGGVARFETAVAAGDYVVSAASSDPAASGDYDLRIEVAPPCGPDLPFALGDSIAEALSDQDCLFDGWTPADSFQLVVTEEEALDLHVSTSDFAPWLYVRNASGVDVGVAWDTDASGQARLQGRLDPGVYDVYVTTLGTALGEYTFSAVYLFCGEPEVLVVGGEGVGKLDPDDCWAENGVPQELWAFELGSETTVRIDLSSDEFDPFLTLRDEAGVDLASNDDGGDGNAARLERTLAAGRYIVAASGVAPGQIGTYRVRVTALPVGQ